ncbi:hypothetical protein VB715_11420 [Crocosphaera sp. UHCC 0190]|uniref:hypothetical protein n=1 Tax=Crocosphaera sp. UHCC 0190 TaxID=3110246 RepID=UPI002B1FC02D|nr:hypothetical protein [Crocosphaera sp. UHCC 0190]MEA5510374.1 hypothetical protein [Crocosphaera sp. UHCC 0190]
MTWPTLKFSKISSLYFYLLLIIIYFLLGIYLITQTSITSDESAYIGAAYSYTQGIGLNQEHPLFIKLVNSAIINLFFSDYTITIPPINIVPGEENSEARLAAFNVGYQFLMMRPENFDKILFSLRICYLLFNSLFLIFLYIYTFLLKTIDAKVSFSLGILFVFSPSFYGHNFLIAFDVLVSVYSLLTIISLMGIIKTLFSPQPKHLLNQFILFTFICFVAINAKFSNLILVPIIVISILTLSLYLIKIGKRILGIKVIILSCLSGLAQLFSIILMYALSFRNLPNQSILENFNRYSQGIKMNLSTAGGVREPFWNGQFVSITSLEYLGKIFWFKENPGLFILGSFLIILGLYKIITERQQLINFFRNWKQPQNLGKLGIIILGISYPLCYFILTHKSRFIIGYRYFYPLIIFLYFGISLLTTLMKQKWQQYVIISSLSLYICLGWLGVSQSLSYVNPLWTQEKWQLTDDSTINWGQETQHGVQYLLTHRLLPEKNTDVITHQTFGVNINFIQYLDLLGRQQNYPLDIQSYYAHPPFNATKSDINQLSEKYLLIDSSVKQQIVANAQKNPIAAKNLEFIQTHQPLYSHNDIIFIYQLKFNTTP